MAVVQVVPCGSAVALFRCSLPGQFAAVDAVVAVTVVAAVDAVVAVTAVAVVDAVASVLAVVAAVCYY